MGDSRGLLPHLCSAGLLGREMWAVVQKLNALSRPVSLPVQNGHDL